ncbi:hypothetical protein AZ044_002852, partial [Pluralibacter gergoviae]
RKLMSYQKIILIMLMSLEYMQAFYLHGESTIRQ